MTTGEVLKAARALVEKRQRTLDLIGDLLTVANTTEDEWNNDKEPPHLRAAVRALDDAAGLDRYLACDQWAAAPGRTLAEVLAAFDKAIAEVGP